MNAYPHSLIASHIRGLGALDANHALLAAVDVGPSTSTYYIWHTANAGLTWAYTALPAIPHDIANPCCASGAPDPTAVFDEVDANTAFVVIGMHSGTDGLNPYVFETTDGGVHWTSKTYNFPDPLLSSPSTYRIQFLTPSVGVAEYQNVISSATTGWGAWTHRTLSADYFQYSPISFISATNWNADGALEYGTVHYHYATTTNRGSTWTEHSVNVPGIAHLDAVHVKFVSPTVWIGTEQTSGSGAFGPSQTIYVTDGGAHWALMGPQPFNGSMATFVDATHGWTGPYDQVPSARLYSTSDGGLHWRLITP